jgi:hypothetical protein
MRRILAPILVVAAISVPVFVRASRAEADASTTAPAEALSAAGACAVVGEWAGTYPPGPYPFSGKPINFSFRADGTGESKSERADSPIVWHMDGANLSFHGTSSGTTRYSCKKEDEGKYSLTFTADCSKVTFGLISDACEGRSKTANGMSLSRK